jgi:integrase
MSCGCLAHDLAACFRRGIATAIGCHTSRATGITDYLKNGGRIEIAQRMAGHSNAKTTGLCDRRNDDVSLDGVERIGI